MLLAACAGALTGCSPHLSPSQMRESGIVRTTRDIEIAHGDTLAVSALVREGEGPPVVYVHGTPGNGASFASYLRDPVGGSTSIAIDRPGFAGSSPERVVTSYESQARAVLAWCDEPSVLVGHSLGGPIVARAAADAPDRVAAIVIIAGALDPDLEEPRWYNRLADGALGGLLPRSMRNSNDEIMDAPGEARALADVLDRVTCPVVILHGARDGLVPVANVEFMERAFVNSPAVESTLLGRGGHPLVWSHEEACRAAIARAIELADARRVTDGT